MTSLKRNFLSLLHVDRLLGTLLGALAVVAALILLLVLAFLLNEAWPVLSGAGWSRFIFDQGWYPLENRFGLTPMVWATLVCGVGAISLAAPIGLAGAIFTRFYAPPWIARLYRLVLTLLAGIPSVVYGLWGLTVLVPLIGRWEPPGASLLAAILILALMIVPTVALTSSAALTTVAASLIQGSAALGLTRKGMILGVVVPAASGGIFSGCVLAVARAVGETMAVLMVAGNVVQNPSSLLVPVRVLTANIALEMAYATGQHRASLFASGLLLTLLVLLLAWWGKKIVERRQHGSH
jgi:phosphate transport system permease protein